MIAATLRSCAFHHMGLAVKDDAAALTYLRALGYETPDEVFDPQQNVHLRLCTAVGRPAVELVRPGHGASPIDSIVSRYNEMIYHTCYETPALEATLAELKQLGLKVLTVSPRKPAVLFGGRHVSFHRIWGVGIVEFLEPA